VSPAGGGDGAATVVVAGGGVADGKLSGFGFCGAVAVMCRFPNAASVRLRSGGRQG